MKSSLKSYSLTQLETVLAEFGLEPYRSQQVFQWLWQKNARRFAEMTNLSKNARQMLEERFNIASPKVGLRTKACDRTEKFLLHLTDGVCIESVYIPEAKRTTICVSTQAGCRLGCKFCATSHIGLTRNLAAHEIAEQVQIIQCAVNEKATNVVLMGMGEPLLNFTEVEKAVGILSSSIGLGISQRHVTVSTAGLVDKMAYLLKSPWKVKLAVSLNFPDEEMRREMMPVANNNPLKDILKIAREYSIKKSMVTFEIVIIDKLNDRLQDARLLVKLLRNIPSKINLIPFNEHPSLPYKSPDEAKVQMIKKFLMDSPHAVTLRKSRGSEILAGCGQLAAEVRK